MPRILIVTGEASGDLHGAHLVKALKALSPDLQIVGIGGASMRAAGAELVSDIPQLDVMGLIGLSAVKSMLQRISRIRTLIKRERWDLVVLIDNPGLNFHFARVAKASGLKVLYYIAPQVWAWRRGRMRWIQQRVDHVVAILPFEEPLYKNAGVRCTFVGNPLLDEISPSYDRAAIRRQFGLTDGGPVIGLFPGSRKAELLEHVPLLLETIRQLAERHPTMQFILAQASSVQDEFLADLLKNSPVPIKVFRNLASEVMAASDLLVVKSGTSTLQAAVVGTPMILFYRAPSWITYRLARLLIRVPWIGLANLVAGRGIVPELIHDEATPERLAHETVRLLTDRSAYDEMKTALRSVREALGTPGASHRAAEAVLAECRS
ncbi:MAG TPA: lipid-A-disaccharide synthase [Nitrospira sp.]|nr:lipid-A-disaccharide synthase [Nitrospira sp.]HNL88774.1 lipid-A-disaccharide synthase [Nitrospira sp.]